jgi:hypothetical protein
MTSSDLAAARHTLLRVTARSKHGHWPVPKARDNSIILLSYTVNIECGAKQDCLLHANCLGTVRLSYWMNTKGDMGLNPHTQAPDLEIAQDPNEVERSH